jgi:hypothetical protein
MTTPRGEGPVITTARTELLPEYGHCNWLYSEHYRMDDRGHPVVPREQLIALCHKCPQLEPCRQQIGAVGLALGERSLNEIVVAGQIVTPEREQAAAALLESIRHAFQIQRNRPYSLHRYSPYADVMAGVYTPELIEELADELDSEDQVELRRRVVNFIRTACLHEERTGSMYQGSVYADTARLYVRDALQLKDFGVVNYWTVAYRHGPETYQRLQAYRRRPPMTGAVFSRIIRLYTQDPEARILAFYDEAARLRTEYPELPQIVINEAAMVHELNREYFIWRYKHNLQQLLDAGYGTRRGFTMPQLVRIALHVPTRPLVIAARQAEYFDQLCIDYADDEDFDEWILSRFAENRYDSIDKVHANIERWRSLYYAFRARYAADENAQDWLIKEAVFLHPQNPTRHIAIWIGLIKRGVIVQPLQAVAGHAGNAEPADAAALEGESWAIASNTRRQHRQIITAWAERLNEKERQALALTHGLEWLLEDEGLGVDPLELLAHFNVPGIAALADYVEDRIIPKLKSTAQENGTID